MFLLFLASVLFTVFGQSFLQGETRRWMVIRLDKLYYWAQWTAFWMTLASLTIVVCSGPLAIGWPMLAVAIGLALCFHFIVRTMPERTNEDRWPLGAVGLRVYVATKRQMWEEERAAHQMRKQFAAVWRTAQGAELVIAEQSIRFTGNGGTQQWGNDGRREYTWEHPERLNYLFMRARMVNSPLRRNLAKREYAQMNYSYNGRDLTFLILEARRLLAVLPDGTALILSR